MTTPGSPRIHILFFSHYFPPEGNAPASRVYALCQRWVRKGHRVTVVTCAPNVPDGKIYEGYRNYPQTQWMEGIQVVRVWTYLAANKGFGRRILNYVSYLFSATIHSLLISSPDVIVATSPQFFCGWTGVLAKGLRRRPLVLEIRDLWPESIVAVGALERGPVLRLLEAMERWLYSAADHVVTVGDGYREKLEEKGIPRTKLTVVTTGVDSELFSPRKPDPELISRYALADKFVCAYIGTIGMASGLGVVLRAARILQERGDQRIRFLLVGDGAVREGLQEEAQQQGLQNVVFAGRRPKSEIPRFLALSGCCLVHLRRQELFHTVLPSKIYEAAAMERPIILGVEGHAARMLAQAQAGITIEPDNEDQLVAAVAGLASEPDHRDRMGRSGRAWVCEHHNWERLAEEYLNLLLRVSARQSRSA